MRSVPEYAYAPAMKHPLYTIGYEGSGIQAFVLTLLDAGVDTLIDVRDLPLSRKKGFSKAVLREILEANGIAYVHLRGLGDPKPGRDAARAGNMKLFKHIFGQHMKTAAAQLDLLVANAHAKEKAVCLMCFERAHCDCHRSIVAAHICKATGLHIQNLRVETKPTRNGHRFIAPDCIAA